MSTQTSPTTFDLRAIDPRLREILDAEPRLELILDQAIHQQTGPGYDRIVAYHSLRLRIIPLVGWHAAHPDLRNSADYQLVLEILINLLPPDKIDELYPPPPPYRTPALARSILRADLPVETNLHVGADTPVGADLRVRP